MRRILLFVLLALGAIAVVVLVAPEAEAPTESTSDEAPVPECAPDDPILSLDSYGGAEGKRKYASPEQAMAGEITSIYPKLHPQAFRQERSNARSEFAHERNGKTVATAVVEQVGEGWTLETFSGCNSVLVDARRGGRP